MVKPAAGNYAIISSNVPASARFRLRIYFKLKLWREAEPDAPDGLWYKDFGSFKICGEGQYPKTFLLRGQPAKGMELE
jgi:hypothetical protein